MDPASKLKVLFVGAFNPTRDGSVGGQLQACQTLINSDINKKVDFILIDSTMETLPPPHLTRRSYLAFKRIFLFLYKLFTQQIDTVFIFTSHGYSFLEKGIMVLIASMFGVSTVLSPRSGIILEDIDNSLVMKGYVKFILRRCDIVLCQSRSWKIIYQKLSKLPSSRFKIIKNWIDPKPYIKFPIEKNNIKLNVLFLGWVERNKGIYDLVSAVNEYKELQSDYNFIICGEGSELKKIKRLVSDYNLSDHFDFKGWVTGAEKLNILRSSDILVMPSYREGLPNSLLEAMASGCSVMASSVGAIPNVIEHKENGILFDKSDIRQIAQSLSLLSSKEIRINMGRHARETIIQQHDINSVWKNVFCVLDFRQNH